MVSTIVTRGMWQIPVAVKHALCSDGIRRRARITGDADTFFSIPASVTVRGKTIKGYITGFENAAGQPDYEFRQVMTGKNYDCLPEWPAMFTAAWDALHAL